MELSVTKSAVASRHYGLGPRYSSIGDDNVWVEFTALARQYSTVNIGHGFPDYQSLPYLDELITQVMSEKNPLMHQYPRSPGHLRLVNAIAKCYSYYMNRKINSASEILITVGADGSLFNILSSCLQEGDEMIIIEPFYECYGPMSQIAGAKCRYVPLKPRPKQDPGQRFTSSADWTWDVSELEAAFNYKTKLIVINTPNNPLGKVYTREELEKVAELCIKHNTLCLADEVYEHITYNEKKHLRIATLPGMWERTLTIGSAGKVFAITGVKIGWTIGPEELIRKCSIVHANSIYCCPTFFQEVVARCFEQENNHLEHEDCYYRALPRELLPKRDYLAKFLIEVGLEPVIPDGGYFILADISKLAAQFESDEHECKDVKFVKYLVKEKGLATIPITAFYSHEHRHLGENFIRFNFFKKDVTLRKAADIIKKLK